MSARLWGLFVDALIYLASRKYAPRLDSHKATDQFTVDAKARADIQRRLRENRNDA
jgi:hypothetical protein